MSKAPTRQKQATIASDREPRPPKPFAARSAADALKSVLDLAFLLRLCSEPLFVVAERSPKKGRKGKAPAPSVYVARALPLREASELCFSLFGLRDLDDPWRWKLGLCPAGQVSRKTWRYPHVPDEVEYLAARRAQLGIEEHEIHEETSDIGTSEKTDGGAASEDDVVRAPSARAGAAHDPKKDRRPSHEPASTRRSPRPGKRDSARDGTRRRATMGAEL